MTESLVSEPAGRVVGFSDFYVYMSQDVLDTVLRTRQTQVSPIQADR